MNRRHGRRLANVRRVAISLLLSFALTLASLPTGGAPATVHRAIQSEDDEASYTDLAFGWSVSWDPQSWTMGGSMPTPANDDGLAGNVVAIAGLDSTLGGVLVGSFTSAGGDLAACLDAVTAQVGEFVGGFSDVREADLELTDAPAGSEQKLSFVQIGGEGGLDGVLYAECRPLVEDVAVLGIGWVTPNAENYESMLPVFEELIAGLDLSEVHPASAGDNEGEETFTDPLHGWSIAYDPGTWEIDGPMEQFADDEDGNRVLTGSGAGFWGKPYATHGNVYIIGDTANADDTAACLDATREKWASGFGDVSDADLDRPTTPAGAESGIYLVSSGQSRTLMYFACWPLVEDESVLSIYWELGEPDSYMEALPVFEELIADLDLSEAHPAGEATGDEEASEGDHAENETFTDPIYGWSIAWDPEAWEASGPIESVGEDDKPGNEMDFLGRDYEGMGYVRIASLATVSLDPAACVDYFKPLTAEELQGDGAIVENRQEPDVELPAAPPDAAQRLFTFNAGSPPDQMRYLECRTLVEGEAVLLIDWYLVDAARYEQALPAFEALIEGIDLSEVHAA